MISTLHPKLSEEPGITILISQAALSPGRLQLSAQHGIDEGAHLRLVEFSNSHGGPKSAGRDGQVCIHKNRISRGAGDHVPLRLLVGAAPVAYKFTTLQSHMNM
jgi:hypothetical protein